MPRVLTAIEAVCLRALRAADRGMNRIYGSRLNPLYASGSIVVGLLVVLLVTGLYLVVFYRIGSPYESVARITDQAWLGRWIRGLHRYASDAAVVAAVVHAFRMFAQGRSWGPRALAWVSGLVLLFVLFVCGWTGYVMVWDVQAQLLAVEGARFLDVLPLFSEPIGRSFVGGAPLPSAFFFLNLFLHIALPIGVGLILWLHVSRVARPTLLPPPALRWGLLALLLGLSVVWPVGMAAQADLLRLPGRVPLDVFYAFWLPATRSVGAGWAWVGAGVAAMIVLAVPWLRRPPEERRPPPSVVDERLCTGCEQCYEDCPYEAIAMIPRPGVDGDGARSSLVARVDPALCVSCGICAGSCAPMGVGPGGRTGRDQLAAVREFVAGDAFAPGSVVVVGCDRSAVGPAAEVGGAAVYPVTCAGNVHTSVIEYLVRSGARGVLVVACPERDCWSREGPRWLEQRLYHDREAELQERVDRRRVRLVHRASGEDLLLASQLAAFRADLAAVEDAEAEESIDLVAVCDTEDGPVVALEETS
jgi:ferredoxin